MLMCFSILFVSCAPKTFLLERPKLLSVYFDRKINHLEKSKNHNIDHQRELIKTQIEYGFGVVMEQADRLLDEDYETALDMYQKANQLFSDAKSSALLVLNQKHTKFEDWIRKDAKINFDKNDIADLYWLAAAYGGSISSSRGNPYELIHLPTVGRLLRTCIAIDSSWNNGAAYSAMMSFTSSRSDLSEKMLRDSVDYYYRKAIILSDSLDASLFVTYSEAIHKTYQERDKFEEKLNFVINMDIKPNDKYELTNLISKNRAKWLLAKTDEYFIE